MAKTRERQERKENSNKVQPYSKEAVIHALAVYRLHRNVTKTSELTGVPVSTIKSWCLGENSLFSREENILAEAERYEKDLSANMHYLMDKSLQVIDEKLPQASAAQAATIYGILFDKEQIIKGNAAQMTQNNIIISDVGLTDDDKLQLMQRVLDRQRRVEAQEVEGKVVEDDKGDIGDTSTVKIPKP